MNRYGSIARAPLLAAVVLAACGGDEAAAAGGGSGGGGGGSAGSGAAAESLSITVAGSATSDDADAASLSGTVFAAQNGSIPAGSTAVTANGGSGPTTLIRVSGKATGTFQCADDTASVSYTDPSGQLFIAAQHVTGTSCTVTVSEYGDVGSRIAGTLTATADRFSTSGAPSGNTTDLTGTFSVVRDADR